MTLEGAELHAIPDEVVYILIAFSQFADAELEVLLVPVSAKTVGPFRKSTYIY
jgi:hypothetical protein